MNVLILSDAHLQHLHGILKNQFDAASFVGPCESDPIEQLIVALRTKPSANDLMCAAVKAGGTIGNFVTYAGVGKDSDSYALAATRLYKEEHGDDFELDDQVLVERSLDGAFISSWLWVPSSTAGIPEMEVLLADMLGHIQSTCPSLADENPVLSAMVGLVNLVIEDDVNLTKFQELAEIVGDSPSASLLLAGEAVTMKMTDLLREVALLAADLKFDPFLIKQVDLWLEDYGVAFDQAFHTIQQA